jgi:hypothetical protein
VEANLGNRGLPYLTRIIDLVREGRIIVLKILIDTKSKESGAY